MNDLRPWLAYILGWQAGARVARRLTVTFIEHSPGGEWRYPDRVAECIAQFEKNAADNPAATWRGRYPGGAVDFETGQLVSDLGEVAA